MAFHGSISVCVWICVCASVSMGLCICGPVSVVVYFFFFFFLASVYLFVIELSFPENYCRLTAFSNKTNHRAKHDKRASQLKTKYK